MIKFGTSGWRAIIAEEFTYANVRRVSRAVAESLIESNGKDSVVAVGYDTRYMSERFASAAANVMASAGLRCLVSETPLPTPAVSHAVRHNGLAGAINITASHNPAEYNGLKFSIDTGAPCPVERTRELEKRIAALPEIAAEEPPAGRIETRDFSGPYFEQIAGLVRMDVIRKSGIRLALDPRWGAARGYYDAILRRHGIEHTVIHDHRDVTYGGVGPDISPRALGELSETVTSGGFTLGLATDGDADRFGIVDADGSCVNANLILALLADHLAGSRGFRQGLGRTYATTGLIDAVARHYEVPVHQTPVGFKYLGEYINEGRIFMAGEESAGMSMIGHLPEKDGILAGLLTAEMVAARGAGIGKLREDLFAKVGALYSQREDFRVTPEQTRRLRSLMDSPPGRIGSRKVSAVTVIDGLRLDFEDGAWLLMRPSGTEPVVRYYVEAPSEQDLSELVKEGKKIL